MKKLTGKTNHCRYLTRFKKSITITLALPPVINRFPHPYTHVQTTTGRVNDCSDKINKNQMEK